MAEPALFENIRAQVHGHGLCSARARMLMCVPAPCGMQVQQQLTRAHACPHCSTRTRKRGSCANASTTSMYGVRGVMGGSLVANMRRKAWLASRARRCMQHGVAGRQGVCQRLVCVSQTLLVAWQPPPAADRQDWPLCFRVITCTLWQA